MRTRAKLTELMIDDCPKRILGGKLLVFTRLDVIISIDASTIANNKTHDVILIGHGYNRQCEMLLYTEVVMKTSTMQDSRKVMY